VIVRVVGGVAAQDEVGVAPVRENATVNEALERSKWTVEILVALSGAGQKAGVQTLQTHAVETQAPLVEFAERRDRLRVGRRFRLTDAVVVTVDTGRLSLDTHRHRGRRGKKTGLVTTDTDTARGRHIQIAGPGAGFGHLTDDSSTALSEGTVSTNASTGGYDATYGLAHITVIVVRDVYSTQ
jgi:hypothetical protein